MARTEFGHVNIISAARFADRVHGLVNISDEMHQEFQRFHPLLPRRISIREHLLEHGDTVDYAVVVILLCIGVLLIRTMAIAGLEKSTRIHWNVDKVPAVGFRAIVPDIVCPNSNCGQIIIAQQFVDFQSRGRSQSRFGNLADNAMALWSPSEHTRRNQN